MLPFSKVSSPLYFAYLIALSWIHFPSSWGTFLKNAFKGDQLLEQWSEGLGEPLSHKNNKNTGNTTKVNHFRTLEMYQSHWLNRKLSIQEKLLNFNKTVVSSPHSPSPAWWVSSHEKLAVSKLMEKSDFSWSSVKSPFLEHSQYFFQVRSYLKNLHSQGVMAIWFDSQLGVAGEGRWYP